MYGGFPGWRQRMWRRRMMLRSSFGCCALVLLGMELVPVGAIAVGILATRRGRG